MHSPLFIAFSLLSSASIRHCLSAPNPRLAFPSQCLDVKLATHQDRWYSEVTGRGFIPGTGAESTALAAFRIRCTTNIIFPLPLPSSSTRLGARRSRITSWGLIITVLAYVERQNCDIFTNYSTCDARFSSECLASLATRLSLFVISSFLSCRTSSSTVSSILIARDALATYPTSEGRQSRVPARSGSRPVSLKHSIVRVARSDFAQLDTAISASTEIPTTFLVAVPSLPDATPSRLSAPGRQGLVL